MSTSTKSRRRPALVLAFALSGLAGVVLGAGCNKPTHDDCRKAIDNMKILLKTDNLKDGDTEGEIRRCRGGSTKAAVQCATKATTLDGLRTCDFMKVPDKKK